ncbi:MAG TPA: hypothetical protein PLE32_11640 [Haliscomenobacter sp.]|nr:hypothetical protein [Haliscomenobacter sp.]
MVGDKIGDLVDDLKEAWENSAITEESEAAKEETVEDKVAEEAAVENKVGVEGEAVMEEEVVAEAEPSTPADEPEAENSTTEDEDAEKKDPIE